jgi:radical SAM protein with 4Fe4S-binding SPASM domain
MLEWEFYSTAFPIQWHITVRCDKKCLHCYTRDPLTYQKELRNELLLEDLLRIADRIEDFRQKYHVHTPIVITGGNPLLREDYRKLLKKLYEGGMRVEILGNPFGLKKEINFLKEVGIRGYQISLDGLKATHDHIRGKGSWEEAMQAIDFLNKNNIPCEVMFTLSNYNAKDLKNVYRLCARKSVRRFSFDRIVPIGAARKLKKLLPDAKEYKEFLFDVFTYVINLSKEGYTTRFSFKDKLWRPLLYEMGIFRPKKTTKIISGCPVGVSGITILSDGTVYPCRRLPIEIGKLPEQTIEEIFFSETLNELRNYESIEGCGECTLLPYCRGNRCVAYGTYGDYFSPDPQCWRVRK